MNEDNETENAQSEQTPMGRVWTYVIISMAVTAIISFVIHENSLNTLKRQNAEEVRKTQDEIVKLTAYRDTLLEASSTDKTHNTQ